MYSTFKNKKQKFQLIILIFYIILKPIYIFSSGLPQIADIFLMLFIFVTIKNKVLIKNSHVYLFLFVFWICLINFYWSISFAVITPIIFSLFYVFNFLAFLAFYQFLSELDNVKIFAKTFLYVILLSLLMQILFSFYFGNEGLRKVILFNNPNQLGYWSLCSIVLSYLMYQSSNKKEKILFYLCFIFGFYLAGISLSKAAILSVFIFLIFYNFSPKKLSKSIVFLVPIFMIFSTTFLSTEFGSNLTSRLDTLGSSNDDNAEGRGYDRIIKYPEFLTGGAGEGVPHDFIVQNDIPPELHSSLGTLFFSYGIIGFVLFLVFISKVVLSSFYISCLALVPLMAYSLTHQGLRSTLFWMILAFLLSYNKFEKKD